MPELPEVETVRRGLERTVVGKTVQSVDVRVAKLFQNPQSIIHAALAGAQLTRVERRAKVLLIHLSSGWVLAIHLKMTGQIIVEQREMLSNERSEASKDVADSTRSTRSGQKQQTGFVGGHPEKAYEQPLPHKHTHIIIEFTDGATLYFNDLRKFGWLRLIQEGEPLQQFLASFHHGPEPLETNFTVDYFLSGLTKRSIPIKTLLLDQSFIAGIGNIYADEALFAAKILPTRKANQVSTAEASRLFQGIRDVLELGIQQGGTSINHYRNVEGTKGGMRKHLKVYGREGEPCVVCGTAIVRKKIGQRSAHYCPHCQG